jgi:hypothetical protein
VFSTTKKRASRTIAISIFVTPSVNHTADGDERGNKKTGLLRPVFSFLQCNDLQSQTVAPKASGVVGWSCFSGQ